MGKYESIWIEKIEAELDSVLPHSPSAEWAARAFPGVNVSPELCAALTAPGRDLLSRGGKRWRPLLCVLVCGALGGGDGALSLAPLVEIAHNASLIHDDIEDNSPERRGQPSIHIRYGVDTAINSGSFLYFLPLVCIEGLEASFQNEVFRLWAEYLRRLHLGQALDIAWHKDEAASPSFEEYSLMCGLKTGSLSRLAAALGTFAAKPPASREIAEVFGDASEKLGVGFQIMDDVKNLAGDIAGKRRGDDIVEGKKSLPILLYTRSCGGDITTVNRCFAAARRNGMDTPEVMELIEKLQRSGAILQAQTLGRKLIHSARSVFAMEVVCGCRPIPQEREALLSLIDSIS
jgi:octaprenyl-diphosphate synthase